MLAKQPGLTLRSNLLHRLRAFFHARSFLEVETPVRLIAPAPEEHIDAEPSGDLFLRTSPELHMKQLVAAGYPRIVQIGPCFRRGERGDRHHPEFTMLEWYRAGTGYLGILDDARDLLRDLATATGAGHATGVLADWLILPVADAFQTWAGWDPTAHFDAERFDLDLVDHVEPNLPRNRAVVLIDYPIQAGALARRKPNAPHLAERWELYLGGLEIANAYSELTDPAEQAARFADATKARDARGKTMYPAATEFLHALTQGLPPCGGIALGIDRLLMAFSGAASLDAVIAFRES